MDLAALALVSYLIGAIPFGWMIGRARGVDLLRQGSGNIGATNVGRVLGWRWGVAVFLLDFVKGAGPTLLAPWVLSEEGWPAGTLSVVAGIAAFLGHLFPIYLGFRGGKGVATGAGVIAVVVPWFTVIVVLVWAVVLGTTRYMSLASLSAATVLVLLCLLAQENPFAPDRIVVSCFCLLAAALVWLRHTGNIRRLLSGTENRL